MPFSASTNSGNDASYRHGPFFLQLEFKKNRDSTAIEPLRLEPQHIKEFTITLDINRFLPSFRLMADDSAGILTHIVPYDHNQSKFHVQLGSTGAEVDETTLFSFDVAGRFPNSNFVYDIEGLLAVNEFFAPDRCRAFNGTIASTLETIAEELGVDSTDISAGLSTEKVILQPGWTNAKLIDYLKYNVIGESKEADFYSFVRCEGSKTVFVFKSVKDFIPASPKYRFTFTPEVQSDGKSGEDYWPILQYRLFDNYKRLGYMGTRRHESSYFDYTNTQFVAQKFDIDNNSDPLYDYHSFTKYHAIDTDDLPEHNIGLGNLGRSNGFTTNFEGATLNRFHKNITDLSKIWIDVIGLNDIYPGDIVELYYLEYTPPVDYMHKGLWMVERVVHVIGNAFVTRLLLTRNGSDPGLDNTLLLAKFDRGKSG